MVLGRINASTVKSEPDPKLKAASDAVATAMLVPLKLALQPLLNGEDALAAGIGEPNALIVRLFGDASTKVLLLAALAPSALNNATTLLQYGSNGVPVATAPPEL